ncbi:MAG TPA: ankyrin repeat domain-containing protein, partial [Humisphaera sp.]|nr:ankyrin repeat domain-containing protein [Humisphaera sp.]
LDTVNLLLERHANPNTPNEHGWTPLMFAARDGYLKIAITLLKHGANTGARDSIGDTAFSLAQHEKHAEIVELLKPPEVKRTQPSTRPGTHPASTAPATTQAVP